MRARAKGKSKMKNRWSKSNSPNPTASQSVSQHTTFSLSSTRSVCCCFKRIKHFSSFSKARKIRTHFSTSSLKWTLPHLFSYADSNIHSFSQLSSSSFHDDDRAALSSPPLSRLCYVASDTTQNKQTSSLFSVSEVKSHLIKNLKLSYFPFLITLKSVSKLVKRVWFDFHPYIVCVCFCLYCESSTYWILCKLSVNSTFPRLYRSQLKFLQEQLFEWWVNTP